MMEYTTVANQSNVEEFIAILLAGVNAANSYSSECFGMSEINRASALNYVCEEFVKRTIIAGYDPMAVLETYFRKNGCYICENEFPELKQAIDESFRVDLSDFNQAMSYAFEVYKRENVIQEGFKHG